MAVGSHGMLGSDPATATGPVEEGQLEPVRPQPFRELPPNHCLELVESRCSWIDSNSKPKRGTATAEVVKSNETVGIGYL